MTYAKPLAMLRSLTRTATQSIQAEYQTAEPTAQEKHMEFNNGSPPTLLLFVAHHKVRLTDSS